MMLYIIRKVWYVRMYNFILFGEEYQSIVENTTTKCCVVKYSSLCYRYM